MRAGRAASRSPDKVPAVRLDTIRRAGEQRIPFTTGHPHRHRRDAARTHRSAAGAARRCTRRYGHLQEIIVQNFRPKPATRMALVPAVALDEHLWTIAVARLLFPPEMNIQAPPNLSAGALRFADRRRDQRLGRRVAGDAGSRQSRSAVAAPADARSAPPTRPARNWWSGWRSTPPMRAPRRRGWTPRCRRGCCTSTDADGWPRTDDWSPGQAGTLPVLRRLRATVHGALETGRIARAARPRAQRRSAE